MHSARHFTHDQAVYRGKTPGIRPTGIPSYGVLHSRKGSGFAPLVCPDISGSAEPEHRPSHIRRQVPSQCDTLMYESATADWCLRTESPPPRLPRCGNSGRQMPDSNPKRPDSRSHSKGISAPLRPWCIPHAGFPIVQGARKSEIHTAGNASCAVCPPATGRLQNRFQSRLFPLGNHRNAGFPCVFEECRSLSDRVQKKGYEPSVPYRFFL